MLRRVFKIISGERNKLSDKGEIILAKTSCCGCGSAESYAACDERALRIAGNGIFVARYADLVNQTAGMSKAEQKQLPDAVRQSILAALK